MLHKIFLIKIKRALPMQYTLCLRCKANQALIYTCCLRESSKNCTATVEQSLKSSLLEGVWTRLDSSPFLERKETTLKCLTQTKSKRSSLVAEHRPLSGNISDLAQAVFTSYKQYAKSAIELCQRLRQHN